MFCKRVALLDWIEQHLGKKEGVRKMTKRPNQPHCAHTNCISKSGFCRFFKSKTDLPGSLEDDEWRSVSLKLSRLAVLGLLEVLSGSESEAGREEDDRFKALASLLIGLGVEVGGLRLKAAAKEDGWKGNMAGFLFPLLPLWSEAAAAAAAAAAMAEIGGISGGDFLEAVVVCTEAAAEAATAAAMALSRSSAKALSRGEMSIIGELEAVEAVELSGEVGWSLAMLFKDVAANMAC
jgi:hypothetical protein